MHATDVSNASRTLLMDLHTCTWSDDILKDLNIPRAMLPEIVPSAHHVGNVCGASGISGLKDVKITGILGDQQSALFGQACFKYKDIKVTYGTGAFLLMNTGAVITSSV